MLICVKINRNINNGVYRAGFATSQEAYDVAVRDVFNALDKVNMSRMSHQVALSMKSVSVVDGLSMITLQ